MVKGALCTGSAAEKCVPPSSHFSRALGSWRRCQQSHRISCWQRLPSHALMQQQTKREEVAENNCTNHKSLKGWTAHLSRWRTARSLGLWRDSTLNAQVCPDVFLPPKRCYVTQNTICCVHSSICQKLNWWENCCNTVNSCHRFKQQTRRSIFPLLKKKKQQHFDIFCITAYPFNCKALMGSGQSWQGHLSLLTFLTQFPRKCLFMCTWKQEADMWGKPEWPKDFCCLIMFL